MATNLLKRGGRYYVRRRVPLDLVDHFGRKEFQKALNTSDRAIAMMLLPAASSGYDILFQRARAELNKKPVVPNPASAMEFDQDQRQGQEEEWSSAEQEDAEHERLRSEADFITARIMASAAELGIPGFSAGTVPSRPVVPQNPIPLALPAAVGTGASPAYVDRSLDRLVDDWEKARQPNSRTASAVRRTVDRFVTMVGNIPVPQIARLHVVQFKDKIQAADLGATAPAAALAHIQALLGFALGNAWVETNPAVGIKADRTKRSTKQARQPFDAGTLQRLFSSKAYTEGFRAPQGAGEALYWLPLLGLYTGGRIEELCQLRPEDIYEESYRTTDGKTAICWVMRIVSNEEHGQEVKNEASERRIPIHRKLLDLGFIAYVGSMRTEPRIFPLLTKDRYGIESTAWSKWWHRDYFRKFCAPSSSKIVFHSFRHTFKDICRECGISKELADALQGHTEGDSSSGYGGEFYPLRPLVDAMGRYEVHAIE